MERVLASLRRMPLEKRMASGACSAFRAFLEPRHLDTNAAFPGANALDTNAASCAVAFLQSQGACVDVRDVLKSFASTRDADLLENALFVVGCIDGAPALVEIMSSHVT